MQPPYRSQLSTKRAPAPLSYVQTFLREVTAADFLRFRSTQHVEKGCVHLYYHPGPLRYDNKPITKEISLCADKIDHVIVKYGSVVVQGCFSKDEKFRQCPWALLGCRQNAVWSENLKDVYWGKDNCLYGLNNNKRMPYPLLSDEPRYTLHTDFWKPIIRQEDWRPPKLWRISNREYGAVQ